MKSGFRSTLRSLFRRFRSDASGQDLVEYAFLAAFIGIAGYIVVMSISGHIGVTYTTWLDPAVGMPSLWDPPNPTAGGS